MIQFKSAMLAAAVLLTGVAHAAAENVAITLNWTIGADHAPIYWAQQRGLYKAAGIDLNIEIGKGSAYAAQRASINASQFGIVDMPTAMQARANGADIVAAFVIYDTSPYTIYWKKSSGIASIKDLNGKKIGTPPADAARLMWPVIAKTAGIEAANVSWVNIAPDAKFAALQSGTIDVTTNFYNIHFVAERIFGSDLGFLRLSSIGFNPYGNSIFVNGAYAAANPETTKKFIQITQKAYADCVKTPKPCLQAVVEAASQDPGDLEKSWMLTAELMKAPAGDVFGGFKDDRVAKDYDLVTTIFGTKPYDYKTIFTNKYLDAALKN